MRSFLGHKSPKCTVSSSAEQSDAEGRRKGSAETSGLKVPPLKIIISQHGEADHHGGGRGGRQTMNSRYQSVPYILVTNNDNNEQPPASGVGAAHGSSGNSDGPSTSGYGNMDTLSVPSSDGRHRSPQRGSRKGYYG